MSHYNDFDADKEAAEKNVYSLHLDNLRLVIVGFAAIIIISGTFFIGLFVGESKEKVYENIGVNSTQTNLNTMTANNAKEPNQNQDLFQVQLPENKDSKSETDLIQNSSIDSDKRSNSKQKNKTYLKNNNGSDLPIYEFKKENLVTRPKKNKSSNQVIGTSRKTNNKTTRKKMDSEKNNAQKKYPIKRGYQIQLASFQDTKRARKVVAELKKIGYSGHISAKKNETGRIIYRVSVGAGKSMKYLEKNLSTIRKKTPYNSAFIIKM